MMKEFGKYVFAAALLLGLSVPLFAQDDVDDDTIARVLQASYPKLEVRQIDVEMIKNLNNRVKVNLKIIDTPAIMYLTWQRYRNQYRWWYERGERNSLVFLGKRPAELSKLATVSRRRTEPAMEKPASQEKQAEEPRTELIDYNKKKAEPEVEESAAEPKEELPEPETEKKEVKDIPAEKAEAPPTEKPEAKAGLPEKTTPPAEKPDEKEVKKEVESAKAPEPQMQKKEEPKAEEATAKKEDSKAADEKPETEEKTSAKETPAEEPEAARKELQEELIEKAPSAKKDEEKLNPTTTATEKSESVPEPKLEHMEEQKPSDVQPETPEEPEPSPFLPVPLATGPTATPEEFLSTFVMTVGKGEEVQYANFLFRPSEMAGEVQERNFQRAVDIWEGQFAAIHQQIKNAAHVSIRRIVLQRPQTPELERTTLTSLKRQVKSVLKVYNYVKIDLAIDGQPAYITIGGLVQTEGGWRVAGRIELVKQISVQ